MIFCRPGGDLDLDFDEFHGDRFYAVREAIHAVWWARAALGVRGT
jgi:hypothetical protein